jgi:SAM-dependent methyltransferase
MSAVSDHYQRLLAPIYLWMAGGPEHALTLGAEDLSSLGITTSSGTAAVDLGAGFGMHAIPLAQLGYSVTAVDSSAVLLGELRRFGEGLGIRTIEGAWATRASFARRGRRTQGPGGIPDKVSDIALGAYRSGVPSGPAGDSGLPQDSSASAVSRSFGG